jgi:hypothetical protein
MQSSPLPCYLIPLGPKYPPQHPILENTQPTLFSENKHQLWVRFELSADVIESNHCLAHDTL